MDIGIVCDIWSGREGGGGGEEREREREEVSSIMFPDYTGCSRKLN